MQLKNWLYTNPPDLNVVSPNTIKVLDDDNMIILCEMCSRYFEGNYNVNEWQVGSLTILPKKGDLTNPNNWRGINILDVASKKIQSSSHQDFKQ